VVGVYDNNPNLSKESYSSAYFFQRLRLEPVFNIAEGLTFNTRIDIMEGNWDSSRTDMTGNGAVPGGVDWERGWVTFQTGIGQFEVGYKTAGNWGTDFASSTGTAPRIQFTTKAGPMVFTAFLEHGNEGNVNYKTKTTAAIPGYYSGLTDADSDSYVAAAIYNYKGGNAGLLYVYKVDGSSKESLVLPSPQTLKAKMHIFEPYFRATFGSVYVEGELDYITGKVSAEDGVLFPAILGGKDSRDRDGIGGYLMAKMAMGPATFGAQVGYSSGDDQATLDKDESGVGGGWDWMPALIMLNSDLDKWGGHNRNTFEGGDKDSKLGFVLYNIFGSYNVTPKFSLGGALTYAQRDKTAANVDKKMGTEVDLTATYKIYDNLTYMVGAGYLFAGDWYKSVTRAATATVAGITAIPAGAEVENDYILMNRLTLTF
jgi:hypothetical protein